MAGDDYYKDVIVKTSHKEVLLTWVQFLAFLMPPLALIFAAFPQDLFLEYNRYPEQTHRVSCV